MLDRVAVFREFSFHFRANSGYGLFDIGDQLQLRGAEYYESTPTELCFVDSAVLRKQLSVDLIEVRLLAFRQQQRFMDAGHGGLGTGIKKLRRCCRSSNAHTK